MEQAEEEGLRDSELSKSLMRILTLQIVHGKTEAPDKLRCNDDSGEAGILVIENGLVFTSNVCSWI